jgi:hypothetical protein
MEMTRLKRNTERIREGAAEGVAKACRLGKPEHGRSRMHQRKVEKRIAMVEASLIYL